MALAAEQPRQGGAAASPSSLVERLRAVHLRMVDAVLGGDGLGRVAELAAEAVGGPVAIVVPRLGAAAVSPEGAADGERLDVLRRHVADRARDRPTALPDWLLSEVPILSGDELVGVVALLRGDELPAPEATEFLHLAAVASLTEVAVEEAKEEVEQNLRGSFLEDLRARPDVEPREIIRRAARLGCDLSRGAVVLCAELTTDRPRHVVATIAGERPGALAQHMDGVGGPARVYALLPAAGGDGAPEATLASGRRLAARLQRHGTVGLSSFYADPGELARAMQEAALVLHVRQESDAPTHEDKDTAPCRLPFRVLASRPEEVRSCYDDTVAPIGRY